MSSGGAMRASSNNHIWMCGIIDVTSTSASKKACYFTQKHKHPKLCRWSLSQGSLLGIERVVYGAMWSKTLRKVHNEVNGQ